jgi:hypothetical protein
MGAHRKNPPNDAAVTIETLAALGYSIIGIAKNLGVSRETFKRWCEEDSELQEAFEIGRETQRQALIALIVKSAVENKPANANAMFLLKTMHGFREFDSAHTKVDVSVAVASPVLVMHDHGSVEEWQEKALAQQRGLMTDNDHTPQLEAPQSAQVAAPACFGPPAYLPPVSEPVSAPTAPPAPTYGAPVWRAKA